MNISKINLNIYSFGYSAGFIESDLRNNFPKQFVSLKTLIEMATLNSLGGIEFPFDHFFKDIPEGIDFVKSAHDLGISCVLDIEKLDIEYMREFVPALSGIGIKSCRIKMRHLDKVFYGGNRYSSKLFASSFDNFKNELKETLPILMKYDFKVLIENHQDLNSKELLSLIESTSAEHVGINWDIGNSLAVAETPSTFFAATKNYIGNVHLKDYQIVKAEKGFGLKRCAIGQGVVEFQKFLPFFLENELSMSIELGAQITRDCHSELSSYWKDIESSCEQDIFEKYIKNNLSSEVPSQTIFELNASPDKIAKSELFEFEQSVNYLKDLSL